MVSCSIDRDSLNSCACLLCRDAQAFAQVTAELSLEDSGGAEELNLSQQPGWPEADDSLLGEEGEQAAGDAASDAPAALEGGSKPGMHQRRAAMEA